MNVSDTKELMKELMNEKAIDWSKVDDAAKQLFPPMAPAFCVPISSDKEVVEVMPGVMVSRHLIEESATCISDSRDASQVERDRVAVLKDQEELRADINASQQVVKEMFERARTPLNFNEKYVSYDSMPAPLQRVIKAYIALTEARAELDQAVKALQLEPPSQA